MKTITEIAHPIQGHKGKWSAMFNVYRNEPRYLISTIESAAVFETPEEAYAGAERALAVLEATDKFPNMCEVF